MHFGLFGHVCRFCDAIWASFALWFLQVVDLSVDGFSPSLFIAIVHKEIAQLGCWFVSLTIAETIARIYLVTSDTLLCWSRTCGVLAFPLECKLKHDFAHMFCLILLLVTC